MNSLASLDVAGKRVFLRCDLNVPIKNGVITDDGRIRASIPTMKNLLERGASLVIGAHLGRPKGEVNSDLSLAPVAKRLQELLGQAVDFQNKNAASILLLENLRFNPAETSKDDAERGAFAKELASYADVYVGDGFGAVHRKHASVYDLPALLEHAPGFLIDAEVDVLKKLTHSPIRPYGVVLGGAKVSDKIGVISNLLDKVDVLIVGGGMVFTFLAANGMQIGKSLVETDLVPTVKDLLLRANSLGVKILLPSDIVVAKEFAENSHPSVVSSDQIPMDQMGLDIGPDSARAFADEIKKCKTVFWNGPMGVFEFANFSNGTKVVAQALTEVKGLAVVGGGDSAAAVRKLGFEDNQFGYISTGGGASLEYLEGKELPGLNALS